MENLIMNKPINGLTTTAKVIRVIDGDTIVIETSRIFTIRLLGIEPNIDVIDTPELHSPNPIQKVQAQACKEYMTKLLGGQEVTVFIPASERHEMKDLLTLGRFLGKLWLNDSDVSQLLNDFMKKENIKKEK